MFFNPGLKMTKISKYAGEDFKPSDIWSIYEK